MKRRVQQERGMVLAIALITLLIVTILGVTGASLVRTNLRIVENIESKEALRNMVESSVQEAIDRGQLLASTPDAFGGNACPFGLQDVAQVATAIDSRCFDVNGDGVADDVGVFYTDVTCMTSEPRRNNTLDFTDANEASCFNPGVYSLCADALWEIDIVAVDRVTGASLETRQAIGSLVPIAVINTVCN